MAFCTLLFNQLCQLLIQNMDSCLVFMTVFLFTKLCFNNLEKHAPPGPKGLPVVGYLYKLGTAMHETLHKLSKIYGPIFQINLGVQKIVVLTDPELIRQTFKREEFTGKPQNPLYDIFQGYGVINIAGDRWKEQRRFLHKHLRDLGMKVSGAGRERMESRIAIEVKKLLGSIISQEGRSFNVETYLKNASANVVCNIMMSVTFERDDPTFQRFMELHKQGFQLFLKADIGNKIPLYRYSPTVRRCVRQLHENRNESISMLKSFVDRRRESFATNRKKDIIDAYLEKEHASRVAGEPVNFDNDNQLLQVMVDLFSAGQETVNISLNWCLIYLLNNPEVVGKVQQEMDAVVGRSRLPTLDDMSKLPYTEATICEIQRICNAVPMGAPHSTTEDTYIAQYFIPSGTTVISNLYSCHMDAKLWKNPNVFDPTRFLDNNGKLFKPQQFMPFGVGRRMCLGQILARSTLMLFITSILHVFNLGFGGETPPTLQGIAGVSMTPHSYKIRFLSRVSETPQMYSSFEIEETEETRGI